MAKRISIYGIVLLDFGHNISPLCMAWMHPGFRSIMLRRPDKFVVLPIALLIIGATAGILTERRFPYFHPFVNSSLSYADIIYIQKNNPFWWLIVIYIFWNAYHFAKQNFGVLSIYRIKSGTYYPESQRLVDLWFCYAIQIAVGATALFFLVRWRPLMETVYILYFILAASLVLVVIREAAITGRYWTPRILFASSQALCLLFPGIFTVAANGFNHWLVAIGLASHVDGNTHGRSPTVFAAIVIILGVLLFWAFFWKSGAALSWNLRDMIDLALPYTGFRLALGFVHFLMDRWLYQFHKPEIRETIGVALFT